jgi:hypothetical protein
MLFSMKMMLKSQEVQVLSASNVATALKHLTEHKVDVTTFMCGADDGGK